MKADVVIVGCGVSGLYCALKLPRDRKIIMLTKSDAESSDSFLAQGGICVQRDDDDYEPFFEDTLRAGHYENDHQSVDIMIRSSRDVIADLVGYGTEFERQGEDFAYTREGAHSRPRILFHKDETGKEITSSLLEAVRGLSNVTLLEHHTAVDIIENDDGCSGVICHDKGGHYFAIHAPYTVLATGGIGGLFEHSTNFRHLTGDGLAIALQHDIALRDADYVQIHPTILYSKSGEREFLISESVRGEGGILLNAAGERFVDELLPRDVVAEAIYRQMEKDGTEHVWLSLEAIPKEKILEHFPNIYIHCLEEGYDITRESIPVVPAQHYYMGGIAVDSNSMTGLNRLYAVGETACNGVHGKNRLASNSLLESLVFAGRAAAHIAAAPVIDIGNGASAVDSEKYINYPDEYQRLVLAAIERTDSHE